MLLPADIGQVGKKQCLSAVSLPGGASTSLSTHTPDHWLPGPCANAQPPGPCANDQPPGLPVRMPSLQASLLTVTRHFILSTVCCRVPFGSCQKDLDCIRSETRLSIFVTALQGTIARGEDRALATGWNPLLSVDVRTGIASDSSAQPLIRNEENKA